MPPCRPCIWRSGLPLLGASRLTPPSPVSAARAPTPSHLVQGHLSWHYDDEYVWGMKASAFTDYKVCTTTKTGGDTVETCQRTPARQIPQATPAQPTSPKPRRPSHVAKATSPKPRRPVLLAPPPRPACRRHVTSSCASLCAVCGSCAFVWPRVVSSLYRADA